MPDTYISQFSGEEIDSALRAAQMISGASTPAELRKKLEIRGDTIPVSAGDSTLISEALTKIPTTSGGGVNPNLLDNWYFGNPVNQRGQTELASGNWSTYFIDRWLATASECAYAITDDGIKISKLPHQYQQIWLQKMERMEKRTYTLSFFLKDIGLLSLTFTPQGSDYTEQTLDGGFIISFTSEANLKNPAIRLLTSASVTVSDVTILAAKLELGDTQTLAHQDSSGNWILNEIPDFGEQLRRCMYYAEKVESKDTPAITNSTFVPSGATSAVFILPYARKRTVPAINFNDVSNYRIIARSISGETTAFSVTAISHLDVGRTKAAILVSFNATDKDYYCFLQRSDNEPAGYAFISADL
jgi:hypothetical protein